MKNNKQDSKKICSEPLIPDSKIVFIIGGARSGKTRFAFEMANRCDGLKVYLATAQPIDREMSERIERHRSERSSEWCTIEEPLEIVDSLKRLSSRYRVVLLDCLTLWLSNLIHNNKDPLNEIERFIETIREEDCNLYMVSNEVGTGIVPVNELARRFRDLSGEMNQRVAKIADEVYNVVVGIPQRLK